MEHSAARSRRSRPRSAEEVIAELRPWFHNLHLPGGLQTAPDHPYGDFPRFKWEELAAILPVRLDGWSVLDVGCNAGFYSFELARRGALVTAIDLNAQYLRQARWAARRFGLQHRVRFRRMQVYDLAQLDERYDLVLFMGVFYHLRYPLLGLDLVAQKVRRLLVFQTLTMGDERRDETPHDLPITERAALSRPGWPQMAFIEHRLAGDPTNWWAPNHAAVEALLRSAGLKVTARPGHELYLCEPDPDNPSPVTTWNAEELRAATGLARRAHLPGSS
jgi:tRNA (mo5U34)-methyltransferase